MPPKKKTTEAAEPPAEPPAQPTGEEPSKDKKTAEAATLRSKPSSHPKYAVMVKEAFKALDSRKGVTPQAIRNYIRKTYPTVDVHRLTYLVSQALTKKLGSGELVRLENPKLPRAKKYRLAPKFKEAKHKSENADPNVQKEAKPHKEGAKKSGKEGTVDTTGIDI
ncbi:linker histone H1M [Nelusetta ayraudi]|uniref:linker histone H1M n=1 Tax=Nelusetta ayraudi TaxID=303726 RepID=UPI003F6E4BFD